MLNNFGDFWILIGYFIMLSVQTFQTLITIYWRGIWWNIIGYVHQFIACCLIPLHPWMYLILMKMIFRRSIILMMRMKILLMMLGSVLFPSSCQHYWLLHISLEELSSSRTGKDGVFWTGKKIFRLIKPQYHFISNIIIHINWNNKQLLSWNREK